MAILGIGVGTALLYATWVFWVPLLPTNLYFPQVDLGKLTGYTWPSALLFLALVVGLYLMYGAGYWLVRQSAADLTVVMAFSAFFCVQLCLAYPATAVDVFGYIAHGRVLALHHVNPLLIAPGEFPSDPIVPYLAFPAEPSQYGPLWVLLNGALALLAQGNLLLEVLLYKALAAVAHLGGAAIIYQIARQLQADPPRARACAYLYAWNPLLLWEMVGNAHNDGLMMLVGLAAMWLLVTHRDLLVLPALAAAALIKMPVALAAPVIAVGVWRHSRARAIEGVLLAVALAAVVYRPFWQGLNTLTALRRTDLFTASLGSVLRLALAPALGLPDATAIARYISLAAFLFIALTAIYLALRDPQPRNVLRLGYFTLLGGLLLATTWFQAWYIVWPFAFGAALPEGRRHLEVALLSLGGLLQYFVFIYLWVMGFFPEPEDLALQAAAYLCILGPLLISLALPWLRSHPQPAFLRQRPPLSAETVRTEPSSGG